MWWLSLGSWQGAGGRRYVNTALHCVQWTFTLPQVLLSEERDYDFDFLITILLYWKKEKSQAAAEARIQEQKTGLMEQKTGLVEQKTGLVEQNTGLPAAPADLDLTFVKPAAPQAQLLKPPEKKEEGGSLPKPPPPPAVFTKLPEKAVSVQTPDIKRIVEPSKKPVVEPPVIQLVEPPGKPLVETKMKPSVEPVMKPTMNATIKPTALVAVFQSMTKRTVKPMVEPAVKIVAPIVAGLTVRSLQELKLELEGEEEARKRVLKGVGQQAYSEFRTLVTNLSSTGQQVIQDYNVGTLYYTIANFGRHPVSPAMRR